MSPAAILERLEREGVTLELFLHFDAPKGLNQETLELLRTHRDALLDHFARERLADTPQGVRVDIAPNVLRNLLVWVAQYHELRLELPNELVLHAAPETVMDALEREPWGIVYRVDRGLILTWGSPPQERLSDYQHLETGEPLVRTVN